jgi:hypothetical protein
MEVAALWQVLSTVLLVPLPDLFWSIMNYDQASVRWTLTIVGIVSFGLGVTALGVTLHLVRLRTLTQEMIDLLRGLPKRSH